MECCPSTNETIVAPDERGKNLRKILHLLYFGEMGVCLIRFFAVSPFAGLF
jgi:hypothetical protein